MSIKKMSLSRQKRKVSFDHGEPARSPKPPARPRGSFDHREYSHKSMTKEPSRHGFFSEFEIIKPAPLQSTYSLHSLKPGPDETFKEKYACKLSTIFPFLRWLPHYELAWLKPDFMAALTVSILQVPQVLAYAVLAGLPPEWGLYASVVPVLLYAIWSTSTKTAVGPGAPSAIMLATACNAVIAEMGVHIDDEGYHETYQQIAMAFTFCCGVVFLILGTLRAGFVIVFLSRPVMTGFIMSASFIIVLSQCRGLMGLDIDRYPLFYVNLIAVIENFHTINWWTTLISAVSLAALFMPKYIPKIPKWVPIPLIVIIVNILLSYFLDFESLGVAVVGAEIQAGFALPKVPNFKYIKDVFPSALIVTVVDYMSNIMLAKGFEQKMKDEYQIQMHQYNSYVKRKIQSENLAVVVVDDDDEKEKEKLRQDKEDEDEGDIPLDELHEHEPGNVKNNAANKNKKKSDEIPTKPVNLPPVDVNANMEFFAYGIANLVGSFFSSQLISASFSRTALNAEMGGHTRIAGIIRVIFCVLCLLFLMPYLSPLPKCVLASVVCTAVYRLIKSGIAEFLFLWRVSKLELIEFGVSVIAPLLIGMEMGIFLSIGTSIVVNLLRHTFASVVFLGRLQTNKNAADIEYVDIAVFKQAEVVNGITIIEMKAELSFSNNLRLVNKIRELLMDGTKYIVVSLNLTSFIDTTAIREIVTLFEDAKESFICLSQCRPTVVELIRRYQRSTEAFPPNVKTFVSTHDAVRFLKRKRKQDDSHDDLSTDMEELSSIKRPDFQSPLMDPRVLQSPLIRQSPMVNALSPAPNMNNLHPPIPEETLPQIAKI